MSRISRSRPKERYYAHEVGRMESGRFADEKTLTESHFCVQTGLPTDEEMDLTLFMNDWGPFQAGSGRAEKALSRREERKALLALQPGETVYYTDRTRPFRRHGAHACDEVEYGELCHVVGPASGTNEGRALKLIVNIETGYQLEFEMSTDYLSEDKPPELPGPFKIGETVYYTGETFRIAGGDREIKHGETGKIIFFPDPRVMEPEEGYELRFQNGSLRVSIRTCFLSKSNPARRETHHQPPPPPPRELSRGAVTAAEAEAEAARLCREGPLGSAAPTSAAADGGRDPTSSQTRPACTVKLVRL